MKIIFTSDYEIYGNGDGSPKDLIVDPTSRMLELFDRYKAKLTIMADTVEILKFKKYRDNFNKDLFYYDQIEEQLKFAVKTGHDVQLHIHPSYYNAIFKNGSWKQDYSEYDLASLSFNKIDQMITEGKLFLETLIRTEINDYDCFAFRAANWSMQPSENIIRALIKNNFRIDSSVFKYGKRSGLVNFDYTDAFSNIIPWPISINNVCDYDVTGNIFEIPIYCENRYLPSFISYNRFIGEFNEKRHPLKNIDHTSNTNQNLFPNTTIQRLKSKIKSLYTKHAWKLDFNKCTGKQLIKTVEYVKKTTDPRYGNLPLVLIGHSKLFNKTNEKQIIPFLEFIASNNDYSFGIFKDLNLKDFKML